MITASEIIENRKIKKAATIKQLNDSETEIRDCSTFNNRNAYLCCGNL